MTVLGREVGALFMNQTDRIRILIAEDHAIVREGLVALFARHNDLHVVAQAADGREAIDLFRRHRPNVVLMDLQMSPVNGVQATCAICAEFPGAAIVVFTALGAEEDICAALQAGAKDWLLKEASHTELLSAIRIAATVTEAGRNDHR